MNEQKISEFLRELFRKQYSRKGYDNSHYQTEIISKDAQLIFEPMLRNFLLDNRDAELGVLQAKVFMYEQIIAKSNFAPMLEAKVIERINENNQDENN